MERAHINAWSIIVYKKYVNAQASIRIKTVNVCTHPREVFLKFPFQKYYSPTFKYVNNKCHMHKYSILHSTGFRVQKASWDHHK